MIPVPLDMLVRQADAVLWLRPKPASPTQSPAASPAVAYELVEVLGGADPPDAHQTEVLLIAGDFDSLTQVHAAPEPGMSVSPAYRYYPGSATGAEPAGHIAFLRRLRRGDQTVFVCVVQGAREPLEKRAAICSLLKSAGLAPAPSRTGDRPPATRPSFWTRLLRRP